MGRADYIDHFLAALFVLIPHKLREVRATLLNRFENLRFSFDQMPRIDGISLGKTRERFLGSAFPTVNPILPIFSPGIRRGHFSMLTGKTAEISRMRRKSAKFRVFFCFFFTFLKFHWEKLRRAKTTKN